MPLTLIISLAFVALRHDALCALARAAASLPSFGRGRTIDYRALAIAEATDAQRLMRAAHVPAADRRITASDARAAGSRLTRSLDLTARLAAHPERTDAITCTVLCDGCKRHPVATTYTALRRGLRTLCETCLHDAADRLFDTTPTPAPLPWEGDYDASATCGCDLCVASVAELEARCDEERNETHARRCTGCNGHGEVPVAYSAHNPTGLRDCPRCGGDGNEPDDDAQPALDEPSIGGLYAGVA